MVHLPQGFVRGLFGPLVLLNAAAIAEPPSAPITGFFRGQPFIRADANASGRVDISDAIFSLGWLFGGGQSSSCKDAADANDDNRLDVSDPIYTLRFLFQGTSPPPSPGPDYCGGDARPGALGCETYPLCTDDFPLIAHVLKRITFGPTEDLYTRIQSKGDLIAYIEEQLDGVPANYDPAVHEPELHERVSSLGIGFPVETGNAAAQAQRLKASLLVHAMSSRWQLHHVLAQFWNNHFHTQVDALGEIFFREAPQGGPALRSTPEMFAVVDGNPADASISEAEWEAFRTIHPSAVPWSDFVRETSVDGLVSEQEFIDHRYVAGWKYWRPVDSAGVSADMEKREYDLYRRLAFGSFRSLAEACAKSVAMLIYLNGFENTVQAPNENYAREILELFVLGVDNVYTQRDIEELAKLLTGWTIDWVSRTPYSPDDLNFQGHPESQPFPLGRREPPPMPFPTQQYWEDEYYTWAYVIRLPDHDWSQKNLFLQRYGGTDSLGNPVPARAELTIPLNNASRNIAAVLGEFNQVLDRLVSFRDAAKFISTKLIQIFVTDDLSRLAKERPIPSDLLREFQSVDANSGGTISRAEWAAPIPLVLPNGRPPQIFDRLDANGDGLVTHREYQEPDLLQACMDTWLATGGNVREVVRTILHADEFLSLKFYRAKIKTPFEVVTSAIRVLGGSVTNQQLVMTTEDLRTAGMELFNFADPTGESELSLDWMHTIGLLERLKYLNRAANPATGQESRLTWSPGSFQSRWGLDTPEESIDFFILLFHNGDVLESQRQLAIDTYNAAAAKKIQAAVGYLLSLPQFEKQ